MKPKIANIYEAKTNFSRLLREVAAGQEWVIAKDGHPIARIVPIEAPPKRTLGLGRGVVRISDDFDAPLPDDIVTAFDAGED